VTRKHLDWKVGKGEQVRVGIDSILVCDEVEKLPAKMIVSLQDKLFFTLNQVGDPNTNDIW